MTIVAVLIAHPWVALVAAALLGWLWARSRSRVALVAAFLWLTYAGWEYAIRRLNPDADIRVDLLVVYPALIVMTLAALWYGPRRRTS